VAALHLWTCIYQASSPEAIRRHASVADLPVDEIVDAARASPDHAALLDLVPELDGHLHGDNPLVAPFDRG
jgi:hypothetical protein